MTRETYINLLENKLYFEIIKAYHRERGKVQLSRDELIDYINKLKTLTMVKDETYVINNVTYNQRGNVNFNLNSFIEYIIEYFNQKYQVGILYNNDRTQQIKIL